MANPRPYFHDRFILLLLTVNSFLAIVCVLSVVLRLDETGGSYIAQYRSNLGIDHFKVGGAKDILSFALFAVLAYVFQLIISMRIYHIRKHAAWAVLMFTTILLIFTLIVSNSLLILR